MTNKIKSYVCTTLSSIITVNLDEAASDVYPYAVMELNTAEEYTKAGVSKIVGTLALHIYASDYNTVDTKGTSVHTAMSAALRTLEYRGRLSDHKVECVDGIWHYTLTYNVAQYNVPVAPTSQNVTDTDEISEQS